MKTSVERLEGNTVKLTVTVPAEDVDRAIEGAYKKIGNKVRVPGFRPGKAPKAVVNNVVGKENVLAEATEDVVNDSYPRALDAESLRPIEAPEMPDLEAVAPGEEYTYEAEVELRPEMTLSGIEGLSMELPAQDPTDKEVDDQIEMFRERYASLEPVEGRAVEADDYLLISFVGTVDGEGYEGNKVDKYLYEIGRGLMPKEFDDGLVGVEPGTETRIEFEVPDTSSNPEFVGKTAEFDVTVHEIKSKVLPELDDEFATNVGGFDSMDALRENVREGLAAQKKYGFERLRERRIREAIAERLEGDVPQPMIASKKDRLYRDLKTNLEARDMTTDDYLVSSGLDPENLDADMEKHAVELVKEELALEALFNQLGYEITDEDLTQELESIGEASNMTASEARERYEQMGLMSVVHEEIMHRRALEWLRENVDVVTVDLSAGTNSEAEEASIEDLPKPAGELDVEPVAEETSEADA
ncbi:MAG: trigger factor [Coriobacteriales bacterium]|nr:trigger factor [Coriobacteriales bacterium]